MKWTTKWTEKRVSKNLEGVDHSVQELDDEERRHFALDDGHEVDPMPEHTDKVVVRRRDHRRDVLWLGGALLCLKEVVAHWAADHALPVLLQENVPWGVYEEQAVDHFGWRPEGKGYEHKPAHNVNQSISENIWINWWEM